MQGGDFAGRGATPRPAGKDDRFHSASGPEAHAQFHRQHHWPEIVAEAVSRGLLVGGGTYRLCGGCLRREAAR